MLSVSPSAEFLDVLARLDVPEDAEILSDDLVAAWHALAQAAAQASPESASGEFQDLLARVGRGRLLPYGSWYLTGCLKSQPLVRLPRDLQRLGIEQDEDAREPEDHVSTLCRTMSLLIEGGKNFAPDTQRRLFADHLDRWIGRFFADLRGARAAPFYAAVGALGERFMALERRYLVPMQ